MIGDEEGRKGRSSTTAGGGIIENARRSGREEEGENAQE
jgi:hypothetical protein